MGSQEDVMMDKRWAAGCLLLLSTLSVSKATEGEQARADDASLQRVVDDYVGLYRQESLPRWRELFLPTFTAASTAADGGVSVRTLEEFYGAQKRYLDTGRAIREELENVRIERQQRLASVWADSVEGDPGEEPPEELVLVRSSSSCREGGRPTPSVHRSRLPTSTATARVSCSRGAPFAELRGINGNTGYVKLFDGATQAQLFRWDGPGHYSFTDGKSHVGATRLSSERASPCSRHAL